MARLTHVHINRKLHVPVMLYVIHVWRRPANRTAELKAKGNSSAAKIDNIVRSISSASLIEPMSIWRARETKQWSQSPDRYRLIAEKMLQQGEPLLAFDVVTEGLSLTHATARL